MQPKEPLSEFKVHLALSTARQLAPRHEHQIEAAGAVRSPSAEALAKQSPHAVANDRPADPSVHRETHAVRLGAIRYGDQNE